MSEVVSIYDMNVPTIPNKTINLAFLIKAPFLIV